MLSAQKFRNDLLKEASIANMNLLVTIKNITVNGAKRGCSGHVRNKDTGIVMYVNTEGSCYEPLLGKAMYRYAADEKDYSSARIPNGFNQWCDEAELASCVIAGLKRKNNFERMNIMNYSKTERISELVRLLNTYRNEYYNKNDPSVSDEVYDRLFDELASLESETGIVLSDSPTNTVGYTAVSNLVKVKHPIPLLSLDKTKSVTELQKFISKNDVLLMLKLDGLTVELDYDGGRLIQASTRGDGDIGEDITHNMAAFKGVPLVIPYTGKLVVTGEAHIHKSDFERMKEVLLDSTGKPYKNIRNLAAGSTRLFDAEECSKRNLTFLPFNVLAGLDDVVDNPNSRNDKLTKLLEYGFGQCAYVPLKTSAESKAIQEYIDFLKETADKQDIPIDGIVAIYDDLTFSDSLGRTGHHYNCGYAFKFEDDQYETVLREIEWDTSRTGEIFPVAIFDTVEIDGCEVSRASLHNISFINKLKLAVGNRILVSKRNMIIPHIEGNLDISEKTICEIPHLCPHCGKPTSIHASVLSNGELSESLFCNNPDCGSQQLKKFVHFAKKKAMNIEGLSEAILGKFFDFGWLCDYSDIYHLNDHREEIIEMDGFGEKSYERLWGAIESSRSTTFVKFLTALDIPMVGNTASRAIGRRFSDDIDAFEQAVSDGFDFTQLDDFGDTLDGNIHEWFKNEENKNLLKKLKDEVTIMTTNTASETKSNPFAGKTIVVTGTLENFTRDSINSKIISLGAIAGSSVSKKTDYVLAGEKAGSKLTKAQALGVPVLTEVQFLEMIGE